jgi:hypothetical protein
VPRTSHGPPEDCPAHTSPPQRIFWLGGGAGDRAGRLIGGPSVAADRSAVTAAAFTRDVVGNATLLSEKYRSLQLDGTAIDSADHLRPSQCSASGLAWAFAPELQRDPTAVQSDGLGQETLDNA